MFGGSASCLFEIVARGFSLHYLIYEVDSLLDRVFLRTVGLPVACLFKI